MRHGRPRRDLRTYLDYNINIVVTGLTGGATAYDNFIGTYKRTTNGGEMGMTSDFTHCETSGYIYNTVSSAVHIQPFDAAGILYPVFASSTGTDVCVTNNAVNDWRSIGGTGGWPNWLSVKGNVDWPITGYSIVGHIYLYSNQNFMTVTPTMTPTTTFTPSPTATPTITKTATQTPTNTLPPNDGGNGSCWASRNSWAGYTVTYTIDRSSIPLALGWDSSIHSAAQTWNNVNPSHFNFIYSENSGNVVSYGLTQNQNSIAETSPNPFFGWVEITQKSTILNSNLSWDTNNIPDPNNPDSNGSQSTVNVQNAVTHELGHWLFLYDISDDGCEAVTMWFSADYGEIKKISLDASDREAINWQYP